MIHVGRLAPTEQWDQHILDLLFDNRLYPTGLTFQRHEGYPNADGAIMIIPGRYWVKNANRISEALAKYQWVLAIRAGDEEDLFHPDRIYHPNIKWWVQYPRTTTDYGDARPIPVGFPPHFDDLRPGFGKNTDVFISGQNTHQRRNECFHALRHVAGEIHATQGFTQGMGRSEYAEWMVSARVAPAPSGPASQDTFRLWEALQSHTVPIADDVTPGYDGTGFWDQFFPGHPFPVLSSYEQLPGYIEDALAGWPANSNRVTAWWMAEKRRMAINLVDDLKALGAL